MTVIGIEEIQNFYRRHADAEAPLKAWLYEVRDAEWKTPNELTKRYPSASILSENRIVFNIKGNNYRLLVQIAFKSQNVFIKKIGTHAEYSKWKL
jgi:mRNA interferase HigB